MSPPLCRGSFRHPPLRPLDGREFAERLTPEQVRGDEVSGAGASVVSVFHSTTPAEAGVQLDDVVN